MAEVIGEDSFVLGSDYPHGDPSRQEDMVAEFRDRKDLSPRMVEKMLSDEPEKALRAIEAIGVLTTKERIDPEENSPRRRWS